MAAVGPSSPSNTELAPGVLASPGALRFAYARSGGPGGQNVNKVNTKVELWLIPEQVTGLTDRAIERLKRLAGRKLTLAGEIHISASDHRSQEGNRQGALARLRELIVQAKVEPKVRKKVKPSRAAKRRRLDDKRRRSEIKSGRRSHGE